MTLTGGGAGAGVRGEVAVRPGFRGMAGEAAARRRWRLGQGGAARRERQLRRPRVAVAGGPAGGGGWNQRWIWAEEGDSLVEDDVSTVGC